MKNFIISLGIAGLLLMACAKHVALSREEYARLSDEKIEIKITLISGELIYTKFYSISNDTLIINEPKQLFYQGRNRLISFSEIAKIEKQQPTHLTKIFGVAFGVAVGFFFASLVLIFSNWEQ